MKKSRSINPTTQWVKTLWQKYKLIKATLVDENWATHHACACSCCEKIWIYKNMLAYHNYWWSRKEVRWCDDCFDLAFENFGQGRVSRIKQEICSYTRSNFRRPPSERKSLSWCKFEHAI